MLEIDRDSVKQATMPFFWVGGLVMVCSPPWRPAVRSCSATRRPDAGPCSLLRAEPARFLRAEGEDVGRARHDRDFGIYSWGTEAADPARSLCTPLVEFEPGYDVKVVDDAGQPVPDGARGEILVRGPTVMLGLHKVDRSESFDRDGFYRTGDEVEVAGDELVFMGRSAT
jgi:acyl-CoA synthetase (AMP-forming)/AMP-acid ligase II